MHENFKSFSIFNPHNFPLLGSERNTYAAQELVDLHAQFGYILKCDINDLQRERPLFVQSVLSICVSGKKQVC
jgi:hypothetical protein